MTFAASFPGPINGTIQCTAVSIVDDDVFEGDEQDFTVEISSVEHLSGAFSNVKCISDCNATITLQDNAADCECVSCSRANPWVCVFDKTFAPLPQM